MEDVGLKDKFDGAFFSSDLGVTKSDPQFFKLVSEKLQVAPQEIDYWDDDKKNVDIANGTGVNGHSYTNFEEFQLENNK